MTKSTLVTSWIMKEIDKVENDIKKKHKKSQYREILTVH